MKWTAYKLVADVFGGRYKKQNPTKYGGALIAVMKTKYYFGSSILLILSIKSSI
jgi:hypothetical protein